MKNKVIVFVATVLLSLSTTCKKEVVIEEAVPVVETYEVTGVGESTALSGGKIISEGTSKVIARGVCWSKNNPPTISDAKSYDAEFDGTFVSKLEGLDLATTYYAMAFAKNSTGFGYGEIKSFTTLGGVSIAETKDASNLGPNSARLNSIVNANYYYSIVSFEWGLTTSYGNTADLPYNINGLIDRPVNTYIYGLNKGTVYHYRVKASNPIGTTYGNDITFRTSDDGADPSIFNSGLTYGTVSDVEGNSYKTIQIGTQTWMAENLRTTKFNNGTSIAVMPEVAGYNPDIPLYGWYNNDVATFKDVYGALYNWYAVDPAIRDVKNVCPVGWHVPGETEWNLLSNYLGGLTAAGGKLKETGMSHWINLNAEATNTSGFTALPAGYNKDGYGDFLNYGSMGFWWSSTISGTSQLPYYMSMSGTAGELSKSTENKLAGMSVRCVKDN